MITGRVSRNKRKNILSHQVLGLFRNYVLFKKNLTSVGIITSVRIVLKIF